MGIKRTVKNWLESSDAYFRMRYSPMMLQAWKIRNPSFARQLRKQESLYAKLLKGKTDLVFDIGGNEGFTADMFLRFAGKVVVVEPSKRNLRILHARFGKADNVHIVPLAASEAPGTLRFFDNSSDHACSTLDEKWRSVQETQHADFVNYDVETTTLDSLIERYGTPDFIKIDAEGHEESVIKGLSSPVPLLSFEVILPYFREHAIRNIYRLHSFDSSCVFNYAVADELHYESFVTANKVISDIGKMGDITIDVFCRS